MDMLRQREQNRLEAAGAEQARHNQAQEGIELAGQQERLEAAREAAEARKAYYGALGQNRQERLVGQQADTRPIGAPVPGNEFDEAAGLIPMGNYRFGAIPTPTKENLNATAPIPLLQPGESAHSAESKLPPMVNWMGTEAQREKVAGEAPAFEDVYSIEPKTGKYVKTGQVPKGSHFTNQPNPPQDHFTPVPLFDATGTHQTGTGAFDTRTGQIAHNIMTPGVAPGAPPQPVISRAAPGAAQAAQEASSTKKALDILDQLDTSIDAAKPYIGLGHGQATNIEQMAGVGSPEAQALGAKMKAAKMAVDHAITGSVRAGASPLLIQQWDNILANKVTPQGLHAGVQAMREVLGGGKSNVRHYDINLNPIAPGAQ